MPEPPKRVAVIAVHGVGSPPRFTTARSVAELLMTKTMAGAYSSFEERFVTVPTAPLDAGTPRTEHASPPKGRMYRAFARIIHDRTKFQNPDEAGTQPDIAFMREQLRDYKSEHTPYETIEITGRRTHDGQRTDVHVFEMYWADLSRLGDGLLRVLGALYQLVLHISYLGRKSLDVAAQVAAARGTRSAAVWRHYAFLHAWSVRIFTTFVPVATLVMLAFAPFFLPAAIVPQHRLIFGTIAAVLFVIVLAGFATYFRGPERNSASWFTAFTFATIAAGLALVFCLSDPTGGVGTTLLVVVLGAIVVGILFMLLGAYNKTRPGARPYGVLLLIVIVVLTWMNSGRVLRHGVGLDGAEQVRLLAFVALQIGWLALMITWAVMWISVAAAVGARLIVARHTRGTEHRRAVRAIWTARITLTVSVFSFIVAALVGYRSIIYLADKATSKASFDPFPHTLDNGQIPIVNAALIAAPPCTAVDGNCAREVLVNLIARSGTSGFVLALAGFAVSLIMVSWFIALVAITAIKAPDPVRNSRRLGYWMTQGFSWMRAAGSLLAWILLIAILAGTIDLAFGSPTRPAWLALSRDWFLNSTGDIVGALSVAVLASAATLGAARLRLEALTKQARPALGILLDVDNYLRESPVSATPRARIAERFVSLLRYVSAKGFDRIVVVSHSQGTVITADLLRFLHAEHAVEARLVTPERVRLMTMGSPLRQLYAANFPNLYEWVDMSDDAPANVAPSAIDGRSPDPAALNVGAWVNLYTTGDYVGRNLWHRDDWERVWDRQEFSEASVGGSRRERCLGAGTHTKYWMSGDVALEIDALIRSAEHGGLMR